MCCCGGSSSEFIAQWTCHIQETLFHLVPSWALQSSHPTHPPFATIHDISNEMPNVARCHCGLTQPIHIPRKHMDPNLQLVILRALSMTDMTGSRDWRHKAQGSISTVGLFISTRERLNPSLEGRLLSQLLVLHSCLVALGNRESQQDSSIKNPTSSRKGCG